MRNKIWIILLLTFISSLAFSEEGIKRYAYKTLADFVESPKNFFLDIQYNIEDVNPVWEKNTTIQTNLFMHLFGIANVNFKTEVLSQKNGVPQITAGLGGWYFWGLKLVKQIPDMKDAGNLDVYGFVPFVTFSYNVNRDVDFFTGTKLSVGHVEMDFRNIVQDQINDKTLKDMIKNSSYINQTYIDPAVYVGMGIRTSATSKIIAQVGYQIIDQRIYAKLNFAGETWEWGIGFYPDSVFVVQPIFNLTFKFDI